MTLTHEASSFAIGSCMSEHGLRDPRYRQFFAEHFTFAVFENELKWAKMESARGRIEYAAADEMLRWLEEKGIPVRGHCIFWDNEVPSWLPGLSDDELAGPPSSTFCHMPKKTEPNLLLSSSIEHVQTPMPPCLHASHINRKKL